MSGTDRQLRHPVRVRYDQKRERIPSWSGGEKTMLVSWSVFVPGLDSIERAAEPDEFVF